ncbi:sigma-54-dependent Fis family transcriptional regulator [bacterium]|nr:MAG: sigma-54-dependent Fis family transcriptional regulator [bacterium]
MERILVVDDEQSMREFLSILLRQSGYAVDAVAGVGEALRKIKSDAFDLIITDLKLPDGNGLEVLEEAKKNDPDAQIIVITAFGTAETAVNAMKKGAYDYITKPFLVDHIRLTVQKAMEKGALSRENRELRRRILTSGASGDFITKSTSALEMLYLVERVAPTGVTVLISGESGTGKEIVAKRIHELSGRKGRFVAVNCSAIPEGLLESELFGHQKGSFTGATSDKAGLFEEASGGTIFLDEVGELPLILQPKLLRAVQSGFIKRVGGNREIEVDVRILSATNRDLSAEVKGGRFREDLFYRLNVVAIKLPPLRDRRNDIPLLAHYFLEKFRVAFGRTIKGISPEVLRCLDSHDFPGNVRELENIIERAVALESGEQLSMKSLPDYLLDEAAGGAPRLERLPEDGVDLEETLLNTELHYIREALGKTGGNKTEAAKLLGLSFRSFRYKLEKLGIS